MNIEASPELHPLTVSQTNRVSGVWTVSVRPS